MTAAALDEIYLQERKRKIMLLSDKAIEMSICHADSD